MQSSSDGLRRTSAIHFFRDDSVGSRLAACCTLAFFLWGNVYPAVAEARDLLSTKPEKRSIQAPIATTPESRRATIEGIRHALFDIRGKLTKHRDKIIKKRGKDGVLHITIIGTKDDVDLTGNRRELARLRAQLVEHDKQVETGFARDSERIKAHGLSATIMQRHDHAVATYRDEKAAFDKGLDALNQERDLNAMIAQTGDLLKRMDRYAPSRSIDPKHLPIQVAVGKARKPFTSPNDFQELFKASPRATKISGDVGRRAISVVELANLPEQTALRRYQAIAPKDHRLGATGGLFAMSVVTPPGPEYLAADEDVQITPAVQALAAQLHHNPVEIYNWVRNSIEWLPSYGSIQGSEMTLQSKRGNAFDTSSLLIALLRASGIPARYVYGTIQVPADKAMNWAGGVTTADAAQNLLGQGGIPNVGLAQGGKVVAIQMEHIWVEAYVDFYPSRGAKNIEPDTWVPLDPSFKQHAFTQAADTSQAVPFDTSAFVSAVEQGATVDDSHGTLQNLNVANIRSQFSDYEARLKTYLDSQSANSTVGDVLGTQQIQPLSLPVLAASLPYHVVARSSPTSAVPDSLHAKFQFGLFQDRGAYSEGSSLFNYQVHTVALAGKQVTLLFVPSSETDQQAMDSYLPSRHADGSNVQPNEYPDSLPGYQINVTPQLRVAGQVVASGGSFPLGTDLVSAAGFTAMDLGSWDISVTAQTAGQATGVGISLQGIYSQQVDAIQAALQSSADKVQANNVSGLTTNELVGDVLSGAIWAYLGAVETHAKVAKQPTGTVASPGLSYGFMHSRVDAQTSYGVITRAFFGGMLTDIPHIRSLGVAKNGAVAPWIAYNQFVGELSSNLERIVPERLFATGQGPDQGISAVQALAVAAAQGQKIFVLSSANQDQIAGVHQSTTVLDNIQNAIAAGNKVMIHESPLVNYGGFSGAGYIITDPQTGSGAYLIEGGASGGAMDDSFAARYFAWTSDHLIKTDPSLWIGLLGFLLPAPAKLFGYTKAFGSTNPYTTVIHGLATMLMEYTGVSAPIAGVIGRALWPLAMFIGIYNFTILIEGLFYAVIEPEFLCPPARTGSRRTLGSASVCVAQA
jgi:transglutaminase-like putative cysteine protease